jgi:hypothetical protein
MRRGFPDGSAARSDSPGYLLPEVIPTSVFERAGNATKPPLKAHPHMLRNDCVVHQIGAEPVQR